MHLKKFLNIETPKSFKVLLVTFVVIAILLKSPMALMMFASVYMIHLIVGWNNYTILFSLISKIILSVILYMMSLQTILTIGWVANANFPLDSSTPIVFVLLFCYVLFRLKQNQYNWICVKTDKQQNKDALKNDIAATISTVILTFVLVAFSVFNYSNSHPDLVLSFINNVDDSSHISMINDKIQFNRGITTNSDASLLTRSAGMYPAGWHSSVAIIIKNLSPNIMPGVSTLKAYIASKIALFSLLVFVTTKYSIELACSSDKNKKHGWILRLSTSTLSLVLLTVVLFDVFREGFYSFLPQLIGITLTFLILQNINLSNHTKGNQWLVAIAWFILINLSLSWVLVIPVVLFAFIIFLFSVFGHSTIKFIKSTIFTHPVLIISPILVVLITYISMSGSSEAISIATAILNQGGIQSYPLNIHLVMIFSVLAALSVGAKKINSSALAAITSVCLLIFATGILYYQTFAVGSPRYYYYKVIYVFMFASIPLVVNFIYKYIRVVNKSSLLAGLSALALISTVLFWQFVNPNTMLFIGGARHLGPEVRQSIYSNLDEYRTDTHILYYLKGYPIVTDNATMLMRSNERHSECGDKAWEAVASTTKFSQALSEIMQYCKSDQIKIIAISYTKDEIKKEIDKHPELTNIEVEYLDVNPPK